MSARKVGCSNGSSQPGSVTNAALELLGASAANPTPAIALRREVKPQEEKPIETKPVEAEPQGPGARLVLGALLQTQYVCAGSLPPGWIKINDAWNPTVCGNPTGVAFNVWTLQRLSDQAPGAIIQACRAAVRPGWVLVGTTWNPTVCGHPDSRESNVMTIKRVSD